MVRKANTAASKPASRGGYSRLLAEVHATVRKLVPRGRTVLVVSRGDEQMVRLEGHRGWHFPRHPDGRYAGYHPESSQAAIVHLEELRAQGAEYLVFPETSRWWLDYYGDMRDHLDDRYRVLGESDSCLIYDIGGSPERDASGDEATRAGEARASSASAVEGLVEWLLPPEATMAFLTVNGAGAEGAAPRRCVRFEPGDDEAAATAGLERLLDQGVGFLVVPPSAFVWLEMRPGLRQHLRDRHRFVTLQRHVCEIYELCGDG